MRKRLYAVLLILLLSFTFSVPSFAAATNPSITGALWTASFSDPYFMGTSMTSTPVVTKDLVYVVNKDVLYALDTKTGKKKKSITLPQRMNSVCDPVLIDNRLYIPLSYGIITCVDIDTFKIAFSSKDMRTKDRKNYQTLGRLSYYNGYLYAGVWTGTGRVSSDSEVASDGVFFCIDGKDGHTVWEYHDDENPVGYYWTQAVVCKNRLFFTSEDGTIIVHALTSDTVYKKRNLTQGKQIRCGLTLDTEKNQIYTVTKDGTILKITISDSGDISSVGRSKIIYDEEDKLSITSTSAPAIYNGRIYVGCISNGYGYLCVIDEATLIPLYAAKGPQRGEIKSKPLVVPSGYNDGTAYVYVTANESAGAMYMLHDTLENDMKNDITLTTLFTPYKDIQYCIANVVLGPDGMLYYSNDSGTLFCIGETYVSSDEPEKTQKEKINELKELIKYLKNILIRLMIHV